MHGLSPVTETFVQNVYNTESGSFLAHFKTISLIFFSSVSPLLGTETPRLHPPPLNLLPPGEGKSDFRTTSVSIFNDHLSCFAFSLTCISVRLKDSFNIFIFRFFIPLRFDTSMGATENTTTCSSGLLIF